MTTLTHYFYAWDYFSFLNSDSIPAIDKNVINYRFNIARLEFSISPFHETSIN